MGNLVESKKFLFNYKIKILQPNSSQRIQAPNSFFFSLSVHKTVTNLINRDSFCTEKIGVILIQKVESQAELKLNPRFRVIGEY